MRRYSEGGIQGAGCLGSKVLRVGYTGEVYTVLCFRGHFGGKYTVLLLPVFSSQTQYSIPGTFSLEHQLVGAGDSDAG